MRTPTTETQRHRENPEGLGRESLEEQKDPLTSKIIAAAIEVHRHLGPGLLETVYEECLCYELQQRGITYERQVPVPLTYKGLKLESTYRLDVLVEDRVILEIKAVDQMLPVFRAQLLSYLRLTGKKVGLLINFLASYVTQGIERLVL
jgi:GxxExxY protein